MQYSIISYNSEILIHINFSNINFCAMTVINPAVLLFWVKKMTIIAWSGMVGETVFSTVSLIFSSSCSWSKYFYRHKNRNNSVNKQSQFWLSILFFLSPLREKFSKATYFFTMIDDFSAWYNLCQVKKPLFLLWHEIRLMIGEIY